MTFFTVAPSLAKGWLYYSRDVIASSPKSTFYKTLAPSMCYRQKEQSIHLKIQTPVRGFCPSSYLSLIILLQDGQYLVYPLNSWKDKVKKLYESPKVIHALFSLLYNDLGSVLCAIIFKTHLISTIWSPVIWIPIYSGSCKSFTQVRKRRNMLLDHWDCMLILR